MDGGHFVPVLVVVLECRPVIPGRSRRLGEDLGCGRLVAHGEGTHHHLRGRLGRRHSDVHAEGAAGAERRRDPEHVDLCGLGRGEPSKVGGARLACTWVGCGGSQTCDASAAVNFDSVWPGWCSFPVGAAPFGGHGGGGAARRAATEAVEVGLDGGPGGRVRGRTHLHQSCAAQRAHERHPRPHPNFPQQFGPALRPDEPLSDGRVCTSERGDSGRRVVDGGD
mmetsp:Transcript_65011/g.188507  ORF Transcript_65011/g.188507 Transcript_65011/m.188507 type:complete len:223 (+) Transcript_65011:637-1305(+)